MLNLVRAPFRRFGVPAPWIQRISLAGALEMRTESPGRGLYDVYGLLCLEKRIGLR